METKKPTTVRKRQPRKRLVQEPPKKKITASMIMVAVVTLATLVALVADIFNRMK